MNHSQLKTRLGELLRVNSKRYPANWRTEHLNLALSSLSKDFDSQLDEDIQSWATVASQGEYAIDTYFAAPQPIFSHPLHVYYVNSDGDQVSIDQRTPEEVALEYPEGTDAGPPEVFCIFNREIRLRPKPDGVYTLNWWIQGYMRPLSGESDTNSWTEKEPFLVLYRAAEHGCIWLLEYDRVAGFEARTEKELMRLIANDSMRDSARRPESKEPG